MSELSRVAHDELGNIIELKPKKVFSYSQICDLLPIVLRITRQYSEKVTGLIQKLENVKHNEKLSLDIENEINASIHDWQVKMEKLGAVTKGLWLADFDSGDGYYCWKFPEERILHWHGYKDGFSGRKAISEYLSRYISIKDKIL